MGEGKESIIPILGFGTWKLHGREVRAAVETALNVGYRYIDTADVYQNHCDVAKAIKTSGIPREQIFLVSKLWMDELSHDRVYQAVNRFIDELSTPYLDLLLIHWPNRNVSIHETLEAMAECCRENIIKHIGVSNFTSKHLFEAVNSNIPIITNQVELHPSFNQKPLCQICSDLQISITAFSPIGQGREVDHPLFQQLSIKYSATPSQIILAWHRQSGIIAIPRSATTQHITENWQSLQLTLDQEDLTLIDNLPQLPRQLNPPFAEFEA